MACHLGSGVPLSRLAVTSLRGVKSAAWKIRLGGDMVFCISSASLEGQDLNLVDELSQCTRGSVLRQVCDETNADECLKHLYH